MSCTDRFTPFPPVVFYIILAFPTQHHPQLSTILCWHCSWSTSSTIPLTLLLPPPHQDHNCSFSPLCHLHTLLRLHPPGMGGEGRRGKTPQQALPPCPGSLTSPTVVERDPSTLLLLLFFFSNCLGAPHPTQGTSPHHLWRRKIRGLQSLDAQLGAISSFPRSCVSSSGFHTFSTTTLVWKGTTPHSGLLSEGQGVLNSHPLYFCVPTFC